MIWIWWMEFLGLVLLMPMAVSCALGEKRKRAAWWVGLGWVVLWVGVGWGVAIAPKFDWEGFSLGGGYWGWAICRAWLHGWSFVPVGVAVVGMWLGGVAVKRGWKAGMVGMAMVASMMPVTLCELEAQAQVTMQELRVMGAMAREGRLRLGERETDAQVLERMEKVWREAQRGGKRELGMEDPEVYYSRVGPVRESVWYGLNGSEMTKEERALHFKCMRLVEVTSAFNVVERIFLLMPWGEWTDAKRMVSDPHGYPFATRGIDRLTEGEGQSENQEAVAERQGKEAGHGNG
jgi:hypothetical protein